MSEKVSRELAQDENFHARRGIVTQQDLVGPSIVQVEIREDGKVLWVNVDGICALRVCRMQEIRVEDKRKSNKCAHAWIVSQARESCALCGIDRP